MFIGMIILVTSAFVCTDVCKQDTFIDTFAANYGHKQNKEKKQVKEEQQKLEEEKVFKHEPTNKPGNLNNHRYNFNTERT